MVVEQRGVTLSAGAKTKVYMQEKRSDPRGEGAMFSSSQAVVDGVVVDNACCGGVFGTGTRARRLVFISWASILRGIQYWGGASPWRRP